MRLYAVYLLLQTALHISGSDATHHQEHIQLHSQHLVVVVVFLLLCCIAHLEELVYFPFMYFFESRLNPTLFCLSFCMGVKLSRLS
jgi:hypothetical protein